MAELSRDLDTDRFVWCGDDDDLMFRRTHVGVEDKNLNIHKFTYRRRWHLAAILLLGWFMYGFFTARPLDFFRAFNLNDEFKSNLALNPMQNFFTTPGSAAPIITPGRGNIILSCGIF